jgi:F0F1-type ATP synthase delta subunit
MEQLDLSDFFTSRSQALDFSARLSTISQAVYATGFDLPKALLEQFGIQKKDKFMDLLRENEISIDSNTALQEFISKICEKATSLPAVSLTIAFEPDEPTLKELSSWFVLNTNHQVLLDVTVDPTLIAGASLTTNGQFRDFSAKSRFDQLLSDYLAGGPVPPAA